MPTTKASGEATGQSTSFVPLPGQDDKTGEAATAVGDDDKMDMDSTDIHGQKRRRDESGLSILFHTIDA